MDWNYNMDECPKSYIEPKTITDKNGVSRTVDNVIDMKVILASADCDTVTVSRWLPKEQRWNMFSKGQTPKAWMHYPAHPDTTPTE